MPAEFKPANFCAGCGYPLALLTLKKVLEATELTARAALGLDIGCALLAIDYLPINTWHAHHGRVTPLMIGYKRGNQEAMAIGCTGDGGAYAIGLQYLLHAALRDEPITILVINNTLYGMTGGQSAPTTMKGQKTDTFPLGSEAKTLLGPELVARVANPAAFVARGAVTDLAQARELLTKALQTQLAGHFSLVELLSFCPTNWKTSGPETASYLKEKMLPVFPLGEIKVK